MKKFVQDYTYVILAVAALAVAAALRPALPVDETRYLTVAWEMWFKKDWIHLSYNFEPYHHKPPMLFWLINVFWHIFGISRWAALIPVFISTIAVVFLTERLCKKLFSDADMLPRVRLMLVGCLPFLIYGSLLMFDMMMTAWTLAALLFLLKYADDRKLLWVIGYGLCMGCGVLTKGPVIFVYALLPGVISPLWLQKGNKYRLIPGVLLGLLVSVLPVMVWLTPIVLESDRDFLYWLLWKQSAGRVAGSFSNAHGRPFYFYLPLLPVFIFPWILFPSFWRNLKQKTKNAFNNYGFRFLMIWMAAGLVVFSLISGKQPHYLAPFVPGMIIAAAFLMKEARNVNLQKATLSLLVIFVAAHAVASRFYFPAYDWRPIAEYVARNQEKDWAYVRNYNGEIGFLARMQHPLTSTNLKKLPEWFEKHPEGMAIIRYKNPEEVKDYEPLFVMPYRVNNFAGVFKKKA